MRNPRVLCNIQATRPRARACILHKTLGLMLYLLHKPHINLPPPYSVELLSLKCCQLSDLFISQLTPALANNHSLLHLDLSCNSLTDNGVTSIATALRLNRTLISLTLTNNKIGDRGLEELTQVGESGVFEHLSTAITLVPLIQF